MQTITMQGVMAATDDLLFSLWERWQDEKEHENIADYGIPIKKITEPLGIEFVKMIQRPFGFEWRNGPNRPIFRTFIKKKGNQIQICSIRKH